MGFRNTAWLSAVQRGSSQLAAPLRKDPRKLRHALLLEATAARRCQRNLPGASVVGGLEQLDEVRSRRLEGLFSRRLSRDA
jgi:hypothetical protein